MGPDGPTQGYGTCKTSTQDPPWLSALPVMSFRCLIMDPSDHLTSTGMPREEMPPPGMPLKQLKILSLVRGVRWLESGEKTAGGLVQQHCDSPWRSWSLGGPWPRLSMSHLRSQCSGLPTPVLTPFTLTAPACWHLLHGMVL